MPLPEAMAFFATSSADRDPQRRHAGYPVLDAGGRVAGVVTRSDILAAGEPEEGLTLEDIMSSPPVVGAPAEPVARVAERMADAGVGRIPIVSEDGALVGIVSRRDLLRARSSSLVAERQRGRLLGPGVAGRPGSS